MHDLALADELRCKFRRASMLARGAAKDERVAQFSTMVSAMPLPYVPET